MKFIKRDYKQDLDLTELSIAAHSGDIVLFKNFLDEEQARQLREQLLNWRYSTMAYQSEDPYPEDLLNFHTPLVNDHKSRKNGSLDYHEDYTGFNMYNYRIGNRYAPEISKYLSVMDQLGPHILDLFYGVVKNKGLIHGRKNPHNLYFEVVQFPAGEGQVERHTHESIFNFGQPINMVVALSEKGRDFQGGGLFIESKNKDVFDLTEEFCFRDAIFFKNDIVHWVSPVTGNKSEHFSKNGGRWSLTMFYY